MTTATGTEKKDAAAPVERRLVALGLLKESPTNPRKSFDEESLKEMAETMKAKGVLEALIVRPIPGTDRFEIIAGARRFRAAKLAGLETVPVDIHKYSDTEALEVQIIENLQREDVAPIDEAFGYRELLKRGYTVEQIAKAIERKPRYVYGRLELQKLAPKVREALEKKEITASHAQVIGRLNSMDQQVEALKGCFMEEWTNEQDSLVQPDNDDRKLRGLVSVRDLEKSVSALVLGAEILATKETIEKAGQKAFIISEKDYNAHRSITSRRRWKAQGAKPCKFPAKGVFVDGEKRGKVIDVCATVNCTQHFKTHPVGGGSASPSAAPAKPKPPTLKEKLARFREETEAEAAEATTKLIYREFITKSPGMLDRDDLEEIALDFAVFGDFYDDSALVEEYPFLKGNNHTALRKVVSAMKDKDLARLIRGIVWNQAATNSYHDGAFKSRKSFLARAKELKVDVAGIEKRAAGEVARRVADKEAQLIGAEKAEKDAGKLVHKLHTSGKKK